MGRSSRLPAQQTAVFACSLRAPRNQLCAQTEGRFLRLGRGPSITLVAYRTRHTGRVQPSHPAHSARSHANHTRVLAQPRFKSHAGRTQARAAVCERAHSCIDAAAQEAGAWAHARVPSAGAARRRGGSGQEWGAGSGLRRPAVRRPRPCAANSTPTLPPHTPRPPPPRAVYTGKPGCGCVYVEPPTMVVCVSLPLALPRWGFQPRPVLHRWWRLYRVGESAG